MSKWQFVALGLTIVLLLGVLAAGLQTLEFTGGTLGSGEFEPDRPDATVILPFPYELLATMFEIMPWFILGVLILAVAVFRRKLLRELTRQKALIAFVGFLVILAMIGARAGQAPTFEEPPLAEQEQEEGTPADFWQPGIPAFGDEDTDQSLPLALPPWITYLAAAVVAVPVVLLVWRLGRRVTHREVITDDDKLKELRGLLADAADELRAGAPVEEVVIHCWARMAEILSPLAGGTDPAITPREFSRLLTRWGVRHEAVSELTGLFEEVRYGAKPDEPRRDRALAALAAIEEAYATG